jgi:hypothetical protein
LWIARPAFTLGDPFELEMIGAQATDGVAQRKLILVEAELHRSSPTRKGRVGNI